MKTTNSIFNKLKLTSLMAFVLLTGIQVCIAQTPSSTYMKRATDFDGDNLSDLTVFDRTRSTFFIRFSSTVGQVSESVGVPGSVPVTGDFGATGLTSLAAFNRSTATWYFKIFNGSTFDTFSLVYGKPGDIPVPANYHGNSCTDLATYDREDAVWTIANCTSPQSEVVTFGFPGGLPVPADFDGDGKDDIATFDSKNGFWAVRNSGNNSEQVVQLGLPGDEPHPADYNGDGKADFAVFRPSNSTVYVMYNGSTEIMQFPFSVTGDFRAQDIDGDAKADFINYNNVAATVDISSSALFVFGNIPLASEGFRPTYRSALNTDIIQGNYLGGNALDLTTVDYSDTTTFWHLTDMNNTNRVFQIPFARGSSVFAVTGESDTILSGDTDGDLYSEPVAVSKLADGNLVWNSLATSGVKNLYYGLNVDVPLFGDFDCDGKDDPTVVRNINGLFYWFINGSTGNRFEQLQWGLAGDTPYAGDTNGDGCDELIVSRNEQALGTKAWYIAHVNNIAETGVFFTVTGINWGFPTDGETSPADFDGDGSDDLVAIRTASGNSTAYVRFFDGQSAAVNIGGEGVLVVGDFNGNGEASFGVVRRGSGSTATTTLYNLDGSTSELNSRVNVDAVITPQSGVKNILASNTSGGGGSTGGGNGPCQRTGGPTDFVDGGGGALWKPHSEGVPNGAPVILLPRRYNGASIKVYGKDGNEVSGGIQKRRCCPNGGRAHWWFYNTRDTMARYRPLTVEIKKDGVTECRRVDDPRRRYD